MRFAFLLFVFLIPFERSFTDTGAHFRVNRIYTVGTHLHLYKGDGFQAKGNYVSTLTESGDFWFYCLSGDDCILHAGIEDSELELDAVEGSVQVSNISKLSIRLRWASADIAHFDQLNLLAYQAPSVLKPNRAARLKVSQQEADVLLLLSERNWNIQAQASEIHGRRQFVSDEAELDSVGHAVVQVNSGRLVIPEVLVSLEDGQ